MSFQGIFLSEQSGPPTKPSIDLAEACGSAFPGAGQGFITCTGSFSWHPSSLICYVIFDDRCGICSFLPVHPTLKQYWRFQPRRWRLDIRCASQDFQVSKHTLNSMALYLLRFHFSIVRHEDYHAGDHTEATGFPRGQQKKDFLTG